MKILFSLIIPIFLLGCVDVNNKNSNLNQKPTLSSHKENTDKIEQRSTGNLICKNLKTDYGKVNQGKIVLSQFVFVNNGNETVKILGYEKSCNCTDLEVTNFSIKPKDSTIIKMIIETKGKNVGKHDVNTTLKTNGQRQFYLLSTNFEVE